MAVGAWSDNSAQEAITHLQKEEKLHTLRTIIMEEYMTSHSERFQDIAYLKKVIIINNNFYWERKGREG